MSGVFRPRSWVPYRQLLSRRVNPTVWTSGEVPFARAVETWTANGLTGSKRATLGRATETVSAQPVSSAKSFDLELAEETISAEALAGSESSGGVLMPALCVEISFNVGASVSQYGVVGDETRGIVGTALVAAADVGEIGGVWTDVTQWVLEGSIRRGSTRVDVPIPSYEAGSMSLTLLNLDRRFDPTNLDGPYVNNGATQITPMRLIRVRAVWDDVTYDLFYGFIDLWDIDWSSSTYSEATVTATDAFKVLSNIDRAETVAVGAGETTGARINRVLDSANWPEADRDISTGDVTVSETTLAESALNELQQVARTEIGDLFVDGSGKVVFRSRSDVTNNSRSALSQATFGDSGDDTELPYQDLGISNDDSAFYNKIRVTRVGGVEQSVSDTSSITTFMEKTYESSDVIMDSDAQALTWAQYLLDRTAEPELRFDQLATDPRRSPGRLYPKVLGAELSDRITVYRRPPGGGAPIHRDVFIRGIEHDFSPLLWKTRLTLSKALDGPAAVHQAESGQQIRRRRAAMARRPLFDYRRQVARVPIGIMSRR